MKKIEYKQVVTNEFPNEEELNALGKEGWELASVVANKEKKELTWFFCRETKQTVIEEINNTHQAILERMTGIIKSQSINGEMKVEGRSLRGQFPIVKFTIENDEAYIYFATIDEDQDVIKSKLSSNNITELCIIAYAMGW